MRNHIQKGDYLTVPAPSGGVASGAPVLIGSLFGVAATTQAVGVDVEIATTGVFDLPKLTGAVTLGAPLFFDATEKKVTTSHNTGANKRVGIAAASALEADATARVRLDGAATTITVDT